MHCLILAVGSYGDVLPLIGLARRLQRRGHHIVFFSSAQFSELAQKAGLTFVPLGSPNDYEEIADNPNLWHPHKGWRIIMQRLTSHALHSAYTVLCQHLEPGRTVLISSTLGFVARLIQETHHIPQVSVHFSPGVFHSAYAPPKMPNVYLPDWLPIWLKQGFWRAIDLAVIDPVVSPSLNQIRRELGLKPVSRIFHTWLHSPDRVLGLFPEWFAPPQPDWPPNTSLTGFPLYDHTHDTVLPEKVEQFLDQHPLPFVFTPGSANKFGKAFFREAARTCQQITHPAIFLTRYPEQLPRDLPPFIEHFSYVPLSQLLPRSRGLIHHGGIGTCAQALRAGIPQLIQPLAFDQFDNGERVQRLGVGHTLLPRHFQGKILLDRLQHMAKDESLLRRCHTIQSKFTGIDSLELACQTIERTASFSQSLPQD